MRIRDTESNGGRTASVRQVLTGRPARTAAVAAPIAIAGLMGVIALGRPAAPRPRGPQQAPEATVAASLAQATYEALPDLRPTVSWVGNTFSGITPPHTPLGNFFPLDVEDISVAPNGTVAIAGPYNEVASSVQIFRDGSWIGTTGHQTAGTRLHSAVAEDPDGKYLFAAAQTGAVRVRPDGRDDPTNPVYNTPQKWPAGTVVDRTITGVAVHGNELYLSDETPVDKAGADPFQGIRILDKDTLQPVRSIPLTGATKLAVTSDGDIWAIQEPTDNDTPARVLKLSGVDGRVIAQLSGVSNPRAVAIDGRGRLLVADAWPDDDIKIFDGKGNPLGTFGAKGGIFSGTGPEIGRWGPARFDRPCGVGVDAAGNIYVLSAGAVWPQVGRLEVYAPKGDTWGGSPLWTAMGMMFGDIAVPDPHDEDTLYTSCSVMHMDWSRTPGHEWSYAGTTLDRNRFPHDPRRDIFAQGAAGRSTFGIRYIDGHPFLFSGLNNIEVSRFDPARTGQISIPSVYVATRDPRTDRATPGWPVGHPAGGGAWIWMDRNGDGQFEPGEYENAEQMSGEARVDAAGNMWWFDNNRFTAWELPVGPHLDAAGNPVYRASDVRRLSLPTGYVKNRALDIMDDRTGDLYVAGVREGEATFSLARFTNWRQSQTGTAAWTTPGVATNIRYEVWPPKPWDVGGLAIAGNYLFVGSAVGNSVRAYRLTDGSPVGKMIGRSPGTLDDPHSFVATLRANGECDIYKADFVHNRNTLFRWVPGANGTPK